MAWVAAWRSAVESAGIDLEGSIVRILGAEKFESRLKPGPGLYRCSASHAAELQPIGTLAEGSRTLVLLHGTGSTTCASFKELWDPGRPMASLFQHYGGRVLGFEHESLTKSPIAMPSGSSPRFPGICPPTPRCIWSRIRAEGWSASCSRAA